MLVQFAAPKTLKKGESKNDVTWPIVDTWFGNLIGWQPGCRRLGAAALSKASMANPANGESN
jgi:hypothetical protein